METVTVSPKFQVVIPKNLRRQLNIQIGQKLKARVCGEHIEPGLDSTVEREDDRV
jgi:AbrB family looped-hinge helix DNA binding protein